MTLMYTMSGGNQNSGGGLGLLLGSFCYENTVYTYDFS